MWRSKTWPRWSRKRTLGQPQSARSSARPAILLIIALLAGLGCLAGLGIADPAAAESPIEVVSSQQRYTFSEAIEFFLEAKAEQPIVEVILFYGRVGDRLVRRIYPSLKPDREIRVTYTEHIESGQFAPGTVFRTWWEIHAEDGSVLVTELQTFEYTDHHHDWQRLAGQRIDFFWYGNAERQARTLLAHGEQTLERLEQDIGITVDRRIRVYMYNSQSDMSRALSRRSEGYDDRVMTLGVAMSEDTLLLLGTHRNAEMVIAHELSHIVVGMATDNPYAGLPRWLDEGLAMYAEGELPLDNQRALNDAIRRNALISVRSMTSYSGQASQVDLFYGQAYSIVHFLLETYGRERLRELLAVFAEGSRQEDALQRVYGFGVDELDSRWRASLGLGPRWTPTAAPPPLEQEALPIASPSATQPTAMAPPTPTPSAAPALRDEDGALCVPTFGILLGGLAVSALVLDRRRREDLP